MRALKITGIVLAALAGVLVLAVVTVLLLVNPNDYRGQIERLTQQKTGRRLELGGPLSLKIFPWLALSASDVKLGNPQGFGPGPFLTVHSASIGVKLLPLLRKRLEVSRIAVDGLTIELVTHGKTAGQINNWQDLLGTQSKSGSAGGTASPTPTTIAGIEIRNSSLLYKDESQKSVTAITNLQLHAGGLGSESAVPMTIEFDYGDGGARPVARVAARARVEIPAALSSVRLSDLDLALNDIHVRGTAAIENLNTMTLRFDLEAGDLDLDRLLPAGSAASADRKANSSKPPTPLPLQALRNLNAHGTLRIRTVTVKHLVFTGVTLPLAAENGRVHLGPTQAGLFGGRYDGDILLDAGPAQAHLSLNEHIKAVDVGAAMQAMSHTTRVSGHGDANVVLTGVGDTDAAILGSLAGKVDVNVGNGAIEGVDLWYELRRARALLKRETIPARTGPERTPFKTLTGSGTVEKGVLRNDDLRIATDYLKASGSGTLDFQTEAIDYHVVADVYKLPPEGAGSELADLKAAEVPILITGSLADMKVRPDIQALAQGRVRQEVNEKVQQKTEELKQKLGEKLKDLLGR